MSSIPSIQVPDMSAIPSRHMPCSPAAPKTPKSMLRNLFTWKKTTSVQEQAATALHTNEAEDWSPVSRSPREPQPVARKPSLSQRSQSDTAVPQRSKTRSKSRRRSRSRCRAIWDPPPLFQAYNQACMHDTLQIPNPRFLDWLPRNASGRSTAKNSDSAEDDKDEVDGSLPIAHRRSMSDSGNPSLSKKLIFLFENGHILQYKGEGSQDRLPERVLELSRESVAFASDAIAGQRWVLEICPYGRPDSDSKSTGAKMPWSRMSLKAPDNKKLAERLLLVYESADALFNWLFAIRKQIECLGGLEYQPDAPPLPQPETKRPTLRHASSDYFRRKNGVLFSRSSSALPLKLDDHTAHEKDLPQLPANLSYQRSVSVKSTAASSVATTTSLEHFRESYSGSSTAGTALSSDMSATSLSPTKDTFLPLLSPTLPKEMKIRTVIDRTGPRTPTSPLFNSEGRSPSPQRTLAPEQDRPPPVPKKDSEEFRDTSRSKTPVQNAVPPPSVIITREVPETNIRSPTILSSLPVPELRKRLRQAQRDFAANEVDAKKDATSHDQLSTLPHHVSKPSLGTSSKGAYGLFPKKLALDVKAEPLVMPNANHVPGLLRTQATDHLEISASPITPVASTFGAALFARSNGTGKRPKPIALPHLLAPVDIEQPMRTPAVTDAMLDTNFGTIPNGAATEPATPVEIRVPDFNDIKIDQSMFESVRQIEAGKRSPSQSPKSRSITPRRSLPNFHYGSNTLPSPPVGPPPSGPLPAVPPVSEVRTNRNSTSSKRQSTQSSANRRMSTKSSASTKKIRSPAPSFSFPNAQSCVSPSPSGKSPPVSSPRSDSSLWTSLPPPPRKQSTPTIGQLSIIPTPPPPPPPPSVPQHKKSLSTSSTKTYRPKKNHARTPSSKSIHGSISNIPSLSHLITPPCGLEYDSDYISRSCFGINASRSST